MATEQPIHEVPAENNSLLENNEKKQAEEIVLKGEPPEDPPILQEEHQQAKQDEADIQEVEICEEKPATVRTLRPRKSETLVEVRKPRKRVKTEPEPPFLEPFQASEEQRETKLEIPTLTSESSSSSAGSTSVKRKRVRKKGHKLGIKKKKTKLGSLEEVEVKHNVLCSAIPSPNTAECDEDQAAVPDEFGSTKDNHLKTREELICECLKPPLHMGPIVNNTAGRQLTCQALNTFEGCDIGCCYDLPDDALTFYRAGVRSGFRLFCSMHVQRLRMHMACPGCGKFCSQGAYVVCSQMHYFHLDCLIEDGGGAYCPHCGDRKPPRAIGLNYKVRREAIFLPKSNCKRNARISSRGLSADQVSPIEIVLPPELAQWKNTEKLGLTDETVEKLLSATCSSLATASDPNAASPRYSYKALHTACRIGDAVKVIKCLSSGLSPLHVYMESEQKSPLHVAAEYGHVPVLHVLIEAGADKDAMDVNLNTPLILAVQAVKNDAVAYLIRAGVSLSLRTDESRTALHVAVRAANYAACILLLSAFQAPPRFIDYIDDGKWTPLVWACELKLFEICRLLLSKGASIDIADKEQNLAIHWAAFGGDPEILGLLVNRPDMDVSVPNAKGDTPIHIAARQDNVDCVISLLAHGASTNLKNMLGEYPYMCAKEGSKTRQLLALNQEMQVLVKRFKDTAPKILCNDISRGRERNQIQCVNGVDNESAPLDFTYVTEYCFTNIMSIDHRITNMQMCNCVDDCTKATCTCTHISFGKWYDDKGNLIPEFNYAHAPVLYECNQLCRCNKVLCKNRVVQHGNNNRFQLFRTENRGWGVKTLKPIEKGSYVCEYFGEVLSDSEADRRLDDTYLFDLDNRETDSYCIDARRYGNISRFINHMCVPNLVPVSVYTDHQDYRFPRMTFFANRNISINEELGYDYGDKFWSIKAHKFPCMCGHKKCKYGATPAPQKPL